MKSLILLILLTAAVAECASHSPQASSNSWRKEPNYVLDDDQPRDGRNLSGRLGYTSLNPGPTSFGSPR
jgi:hypothetical protein